ncbi:MAG: S8 family serine peptidase [Gammaproteobacteria bacterium]|nr:S8 family serine peptidase [Gammaproteobacteria bacterium]
MSLQRNAFAAIALLALITMLAGCGGGGGGSGSPPAPTYSISGTLSAAAYTAMDSDVNDPEAPYAPNNTADQAQPVGNPVTIGGYVNRRGRGPAGRLSRNGDVSDFYKVELAANQTITLSIGETDLVNNDMDIYLYDAGKRLVDSTEGVTRIEAITVATPGSYYVEVYAYAGASSYTLTIGLASVQSHPATLGIGSDFVPGDIIVRFKDDTPGARAASTVSPAARAQALGLTVKDGDAGRPLLFGLGDAASRAQMRSALNIPATDNSAAGDPLQLKRETIQAIKALRKRPDIAYAEPNYIRHAMAIPNDEFYPRQWHYPMINLPQAWDITTGSSNVIVAVIDTGVLLNHPDLQGKFVPGYDFISDPTNALDGNGIDSNPDDPGDQGTAGSSFHGTHVAGTIAAASDNGTGVAGVAWQTRIMPLRVLGKRGGTSYDITQAVLYAAGLVNDSGAIPSQPADVINLSLGGGGFSQTEQDAYTRARAQGVIIVAAAGNEASNTPSYPAAYDGVVSVSAVDINKNLAYYSNFGSTIDIAAPGGDSRRDINGDGYPDGIFSTRGNDAGTSVQYSYQFQQGTSMAAPHVAGVVALMKAVNSQLTPALFDQLLASGSLSQDLGNSGRDDSYGDGLIDAYKAVSAAQGTALKPTLIVSPSALNFGLTTTELELAAGSIGGDVTLTAATPGASWLTIVEKSVDPVTKNGAYTVRVNRANLPVGAYSTTLTFTSAANTVTIAVIMQAGNPATSTGNAGRHYVLLINPETGAVVTQTGADADSKGEYRYTLTGVPSGIYQIIAGSDSNNNRFICNPGEACGSYLTLEQPKLITVSGGDVTGIDFATGFDASQRAGLSAQARQK